MTDISHGSMSQNMTFSTVANELSYDIFPGVNELSYDSLIPSIP